MSYNRVIPRDLFNEANLLKCLGQLFIALENTRGHAAKMGDGDQHGALDDYSGAPFDIDQCPATGGILVRNLPFSIGGKAYDLTRPLNSRQPWPLYCVDRETEDECAVFDDDGRLSDDFLALIGERQ